MKNAAKIMKCFKGILIVFILMFFCCGVEKKLDDLEGERYNRETKKVEKKNDQGEWEEKK